MPKTAQDERVQTAAAKGRFHRVAGAGAPGPWTLGVALGLLALALLAMNLDHAGLWSKADLPILDRSRGALGVSLTDLTTSPWLPDALRTQAFAWIGGDRGIRLPGALAVAALVGVSAGLMRHLGGGVLLALLAGLFALSFPLVQVAGSTIQGNPIGELLAVLAVLFGAAALRGEQGRGHSEPRVGRVRLRRLTRLLAATLSLASLAASISSSGIIIGGTLPLAALAFAAADLRQRGSRDWVSILLWSCAAGSAAMGLYLIVGQGEGFIPLLGAAKDLELLERPLKRPLAAGLREMGNLLFPWGALALAGALLPGRAWLGRWLGRWLVLGVALVSLWAHVYGFTTLPLTVPAAIMCAHATGTMLHAQTPALLRRTALAVVLIGIVVLAKDAKTSPREVSSPLHNLKGKQGFPGAEIDASQRLGRMGTVAGLGLLLAFIAAPQGRNDRPTPAAPTAPPAKTARSWLRRHRLSDPLRVSLSAAIIVSTVAVQIVAFDSLLRDLSGHLSLQPPLARYAQWASEKKVPEPLASYHVRDPGMERYGPKAGGLEILNSRSDLHSWLAAPPETPRIALIRRLDFAALFQVSREKKRSLHVLDWSHHEVALVSNTLPEGLVDADPLGEIVLDNPPTLEHETFVRFGDYVELLGWQLDGHVKRGGSTTLHLVFRVLRRLPRNTKVIGRLQMGKMSRINAEAHVLTNGLYPPNNWRRGDYIHHAFEFDISRIAALPGEHDVIIALKKTEKKSIEVTDPPKPPPKPKPEPEPNAATEEGTQDSPRDLPHDLPQIAPAVPDLAPASDLGGAHGVKVKGKQHAYATIGTVTVE